MFPLRDENPTDRTPWVTVLLIAANTAVWLYLQGGGMSEARLQASVCTYGVIPAELTGATAGRIGAVLAEDFACRFGGLTWATLGSSLFLHGSWLHLIGNMWFLWIFGNNIEDAMGHVRYVLFYLLAGLAATGAHILSAPASAVPTIGASGAISGVMGAYLVLYPRVRIETLFVLFFFVRIIAIPAWFVLGEWFLIQILSGWTVTAADGGIAFWAHIGGFVAGVLLVKPFEDRRHARARRARRVAH